MHGLFVSDLHLLSPRSACPHIETELADYAGAHKCIVLGGDIFDFRWSDRGGHDQTLEATSRWLQDLQLATENTDIIYLPGNHDCHPDFLEQLEKLSQQSKNFSWQPHHLQLGNNLFFHGDILDAGNSLEDLQRYRRQFHHVKPQSQWAHRSYDTAVGLRVHKLVPRILHQPMRTCQRLQNAIDRLNLDDAKAVRNVFFGHTHVPIEGLKLNGRSFYNPGAGMKHMQLQPHEFTFERAIPASEIPLASDTSTKPPSK
ncbi:Calcineurin-like phosphoesterase superfamily domain protein [Aureliella helgolandensis]|uniref:Calcineurin-like phosphoesterase superfamily domain protein n=1 Tax=Aureliella helgolandensis TaxID=2527968 RepID=A0A518GHM5_9BACT|nr:Calcineurin-like phosphoesterase superfamily domain protein [Aureliella helgolandensis]